MASLMDNNGYFIPFNQPVEAPDTTINEQPITCVTFNEKWLPLVVGALKVLARPETYISGEFTPIESAHEGHDLLANIGTCPETVYTLPNWGMRFVGSYSPYNIFTLSSDFTRGQRVVYGAFLPTELTIPRVVMTGVQIVNQSLWAGGIVRHLWFNTIDSAQNVYTYSYHNCLGEITAVTDFGSYLIFNNLECRDFTIDWDTQTGLMMQLVIEDDWLCGQI